MIGNLFISSFFAPACGLLVGSYNKESRRA